MPEIVTMLGCIHNTSKAYGDEVECDGEHAEPHQDQDTDPRILSGRTSTRRAKAGLASRPRNPRVTPMADIATRRGWRRGALQVPPQGWADVGGLQGRIKEAGRLHDQSAAMMDQCLTSLDAAGSVQWAWRCWAGSPRLVSTLARPCLYWTLSLLFLCWLELANIATRLPPIAPWRLRAL
jgi:hypothetical protein